MKIFSIFSILLLISLNIEAKNMPRFSKDKTEEKKQVSTVHFDFGKNELDYGCISKVADVDNKESKKLTALYYSVIHEAWRTNQDLNKIEEPTLNNINNQLKSLCNRAMSQEKNIEFMLYKEAITFKMTHERFFEIWESINSHQF